MKINTVKIIIFKIIWFLVSLLIIETASFIINYVFDFEGYDIPGEWIPYNVYHPYLGWVPRPNDKINTSKPFGCSPVPTFIYTDSLGFSSTPFYFKNPDLKILIFGGSTMFGVGSSNNENTVPSLIEKRLNKMFNNNIDVMNLSVRAYQSFQEMLFLHAFFQEYEADLVLDISGRNDAFYWYFSDNSTISRRATSYRLKETIISAENGKRIVLNPILTYKNLKKLRVSNSINLCYHIKDKLLSIITTGNNHDDFKNKQDFSVDDIQKRVEITNNNVEMINTLCRRNEAKFIYFLQPTAYSKKKLSKQEETCDTSNFYQNKKLESSFFDELISIRKDYQFYDLTHIFDSIDKTTFIDRCHYSDLGASVLADTVVNKIKYQVEDLLKLKFNK